MSEPNTPIEANLTLNSNTSTYTNTETTTSWTTGMQILSQTLIMNEYIK